MQQGSTDSSSGGANAQAGSGLAPNVAAALSYVLGFITGIIFVLVEKDRFVRFHAFQSILLSAAWVVVWIVLSILEGILAVIPIINILALILGFLISIGLGLGGFVLWLVLIVRAYQGARWKLPYIGEMAERYANS